MELILKMYRTWSMWNFLPTVILFFSWTAAITAAETIVLLKVRGDQFVDAGGHEYRLWGVNSVSFYPDHKLAEKVAENFACQGINCVRPHHMLRKSTDWNPKLPGGGLLLYQEDSTTPDHEAYDRFFYYTNELRKRGIYLLLSIGDTRLYLPDDVKIIDGGEEDNARWRKSIEELNSRPWQESHDVKKLLPLVDERAARLYETYIDRLMGTVNPYSGKRFADDPQVLTVELLNEFSLEYAVICRNRLPEYQKERFQAEWARFAESRGLQAGDVFNVHEPDAVQAWGEFLQRLEKRFIDRMTAKLRTLGYRGAVLYSNLWRGEKASLLAAEKTTRSKIMPMWIPVSEICRISSMRRPRAELPESLTFSANSISANMAAVWKARRKSGHCCHRRPPPGGRFITGPAWCGSPGATAAARSTATAGPRSRHARRNSTIWSATR